MLRKLLGAGMLLATLAGCTKLEGHACTSNAECAEFGGVCDTDVGRCFQVEETNDCAIPCAAYEACSSGKCEPRFTAVNITAPIEGARLDGGTVQVSAQLVADPDFKSTTFPDEIALRAEGNGGDAGSFGPMTRNGDTYTAAWTPPAAQAEIALIAAHPEPAVGLSDTVNVTVDALPPDITVVVPTAQVPAPSGGFIYGEPNQPPAWRRDEAVEVRIESNATDLDPTSLQIIVRGHNGGADVTDLMPETCQGSPAAFCRRVTVPLSRPGLDAFNGAFTVEAAAKDTAGNESRKTGTLPVTRWKWSFDAAGPIKATPAVGEKGYVYFGTAVAPGKLFALKQNGTKHWELDVDAVEGSPTVGAWSNETELVYVSGNFTGIAVVGDGVRIRAISGAHGVVRNDPCVYSVVSGTPPVVNAAGAITETTIGTTRVETGLFVVSGNYKSAVGIRPTTVNSTTMGCVFSDNSQNMPNTSPNGGLVATNAGEFAYPTDARRIVKYAFNSSNALLNATPGAGGGQRMFGMALVGNNLLASGGSDFDQGGVFPVAFDAIGTPTLTALAGTEDGRVNQLVAGADGQLYFGRELTAASAQLVKHNLPGPNVVTSISDTGVFQSAPVLGSDGRLYTVNVNGQLIARATANLAEQWRRPNLGTNAGASPTLDCARSADGTPLGTNVPGVLYVAAGNKMHAFVVDSPRMPKEPNSWPKYQHDARNTGNPATPITNCP